MIKFNKKIKIKIYNFKKIKKITRTIKNNNGSVIKKYKPKNYIDHKSINSNP